MTTKKPKHSPHGKQSGGVTDRGWWVRLLIMDLQSLAETFSEEDCSIMRHEYLEVPGTDYVFTMRINKTHIKGGLKLVRDKSTSFLDDLYRQGAEIVNPSSEQEK